MNADRLRLSLLALPHVVETLQWTDNLVLWVGDKAIGGKMFALISLEASERRDASALLSFPVGSELFAQLLEVERVIPAPYLARAHWVSATSWDVFTSREWEAHLQHAHSLTLAKLPSRTRAILALPVAQQKRAVAARRKLLAEAGSTRPLRR